MDEPQMNCEHDVSMCAGLGLSPWFIFFKSDSKRIMLLFSYWNYIIDNYSELKEDSRSEAAILWILAVTEKYSAWLLKTLFIQPGSSCSL